MTGSLSQQAANLHSQGASAPELGIAMLMEMAEQGEIDPWDVQVIDVIDRFLSTLAAVPVAGVSPGNAASLLEREAALSQSGQAFLYASMLVLLKADTLARLQEESEEEQLLEEEAPILEGDGLISVRNSVQLDRCIRRRAVAQPPQKRRVTLQELIEQLQVMATEIQERPRRPRTKKHRPKSSAQTARAIAGLAHHENLNEVAAALEKFLAQRWPEISQNQEWINLDELLSFWEPSAPPELDHPPEPQSERVAVFWGLLLLCSQSKVELLQEEFYQDLKIRAINENTPPSASTENNINLNNAT
ncbi:segregation/condensation protein A [Ancylothrix sp. C2]|uniref:segregation/condensation protein A n=1 Tax=Ancylothrix sp. D3o TaxID=2953691 RepID=UPI0021BAC47F|nr:segregation/condensation protein A [Ancylothrix sp. D3o]MCT7949309.1 segregation/condensation protein A [Ancylothrix sp. D3o]